MSHAQAAIIDRPEVAARSAPARALSPSAERYAPFVRIAALQAVWIRPERPESVLGIELRRCRARQLIYCHGPPEKGRRAGQTLRPRKAATRSCRGALSGQFASGPKTVGVRTSSAGAPCAAAIAISPTSS